MCTKTVAEALDATYYLEQAAKLTVKAMSTGLPLKLIKDEVGAHSRWLRTHLVHLL